ncbi:MAG: type II CRISPR-associated endonuclease Cas1 [Ruminococcus sp.]|nr:type II CRISPR-associated endonuclease Cas1 [Ruminococcus sp.]
MGYRIIFLTNPVKLSTKNEQLMIDNGEVTRVPLEDIECIVADTSQLNVTARLLSKFSEYAITFYITDKSHHPCGVFLPVCKHCRHMSVLQNQINMTLPTKKKLWKQIIYQKIENQATVLKLCNIENWAEIENLKNKVKSGDTDNMEAVAASKYFKLLFGKTFTRTQENGINAALNYGYAILRSTIEKYLIAYGYEPSIGLFHKSTLNNFNLADDIIEAYRPIVDLFVNRFVCESDELSTVRKAQLVNLLNCDVIIDKKIFACAHSIEISVNSLTSFIRKNRNDLLLPQIIDLEQHKYE